MTEVKDEQGQGRDRGSKRDLRDQEKGIKGQDNMRIGRKGTRGGRNKTNKLGIKGRDGGQRTRKG